MARGMKINCFLTEQNGDYKIDFHYGDTRGIKVNKKIRGNDPEEMVNELTQDIVQDYLTQDTKLKQIKEAEAKKQDDIEENAKVRKDDVYIAQLEKIIEDLTYENNSLKTDLDVLQKRVDDAVNQAQQEPEEKEEELAEDIFDHLFDDFDFKPMRYWHKKHWL